MAGENDAAEETLQDGNGGVPENAGLAWLRKCRRILEFTLKARPQEGCGQRKAGGRVLALNVDNGEKCICGVEGG